MSGSLLSGSIIGFLFLFQLLVNIVCVDIAVKTIYKDVMRNLTKQEQELWAKVCATINGGKRVRVKFLTPPPIQVGSCLDLHGYTEDTAYSAISQLLASNRQAGNKQVTIITGKGKGGIGVLRRLVPYWLDSSMSNYVRSYYFDPKNLGQLIVLLK